MEYPPEPMNKSEDTSVLLLIWKENKNNSTKNAWAMVENLNGADAPEISECGGISLDLPEERLVKPHSLRVGSYLYCIGGTTYDRVRKFGDPSLSSKVFRFDINQPYEGWKVCHHLPFFCGNIQTAVSGHLIYIFPHEDRFYKQATATEPFYCSKDWAYIFDTKDIIRSKFIACPIPNCCVVAVCASLDDVACVGKGVMVYLKDYYSGVAWFHDPVHNSWQTHDSLFGFKAPDPVIPPRINIFPEVYAYTVSNGIIYMFRVVRDSEDDELEHTPLLSAYDIGKGKLLFRDLSFKAPHSSSGQHFINFLFAVGDCKLCWFEYFPGEEVLSYTIISISYGAGDPSLSVCKSGVLENFQFCSLPACLAIDSFCLDRIKRISPPVVQQESSKRPHFEYARNPDSPQTSILMLFVRAMKNKVEIGWAMINNLDSTFRPQIIVYNQSSLALPEGFESEVLPPLYPLLVGSHLYCIGSVVDLESGTHFLADKVLRYDIPSAAWQVFCCLPFFCKDILIAVSGDLIYFFPCGKTRLHSKSEAIDYSSVWAYILDTKECKGQYISSPPTQQSVTVAVCASVDGVVGVRPGVIVYLLYGFMEEAWFHDPVQKSWALYSRFKGRHYLKPYLPQGKIATTASKGILYTLRFRKKVKQPLLTAFDIVKEKQLFRDLKLIGTCSSSGRAVINYLFAIGDCKLCWLEFFRKGLIQYTIISVPYDPVSQLQVDKSGMFPDYQFVSDPSFVACDSFCLDWIKSLPQQVV